MKRVSIALATLLFTLPASADDRFDSLRTQAQRVDSLSGFLERFVGGCKDSFEKRSCEENVRAARKGLAGKLMVVSIGDRTPEIVRAEVVGDHFRILVTPFVDGGGYALTQGVPAKQDSAGRPLINYIVIEGALPPGGELEFQGPFRTGHVDMEVLFKPEGTWKLKRKGEPGFYEGVKARFVGLRLIDQRTGSEIAAKMLGGA